MWYPHKLKRLERESPGPSASGWCSPDADVVDDRLRPAGYRLWQARRAVGRNRRLIARGRLFEALVRDNLVTGCTAAFRSGLQGSRHTRPGGVRARSWSALVVAAVADVARIDAPLLAYRQHAANQYGLARYHGKKRNGSGPRLPKSTAEKLLQAEGRLARLRAAYSRLEQNRDRYPVGQTQPSCSAAPSGTPNGGSPFWARPARRGAC